MGRKLIRRLPVERVEKVEGHPSNRIAKGHIAIIVAQHLVVYSSGYVIASTAYLIHSGTITRDLLPTAIMLEFSACASIMFVVLYNVTAWRSCQPSRTSFPTSPVCLKALTKHGLQFVATAWMVASGLTIPFTVARHPSCLTSRRAILYAPAIDVGRQCIMQRASVAASLLAMIISVALFILTLKTTDPYLAHLFGVSRRPQLLPLILPYKTGDHTMFSDMSFKCRSTSTFSSCTIAEPHQDNLYTLYRTRPEKAYGLGIYAPKLSGASFLTPRPSLKTIRSQASLGNPTLKSSPVPPLPVYNPEKYKDLAVVPKRPKRPRRGDTIRREGSQRLLHLALRAQTTSDAKLHSLKRNDSKKSLSSIYSRSISGDSPDPNRQAQNEMALRRQVSPATHKLHPRGRPPIIVQQGPIAHSTNHHSNRSGLREVSFDQGVSAGSPLRLPEVRGVSTFGDVQGWDSGKQGNRQALARTSTWSERCNLPPLPVEKAKPCW